MTTLRFLILMLLPPLVLAEDELITCFSCETDADCAVGSCIAHQCTDEFGLFRDGCDCQSDIDCDSGLCRRFCKSNGVVCANISDCLDGECALWALCVAAAVPSPAASPSSADPSKRKIMPFWAGVIIVVSILGAILCIIFTARNEACNDCCCECLTGCCLICES